MLYTPYSGFLFNQWLNDSYMNSLDTITHVRYQIGGADRIAS